MKIPKYIRQRMEKCLLYNIRAADAMKEIEDWLESHGIDPERLRDGCGISLEEIEYGNDVIDDLCERIEQEF